MTELELDPQDPGSEGMSFPEDGSGGWINPRDLTGIWIPWNPEESVEGRVRIQIRHPRAMGWDGIFRLGRMGEGLGMDGEAGEEWSGMEPLGAVWLPRGGVL